MKLRDKKGFTLIELLVVISIIGILAIVAVPSLLQNTHKAKVAEVENDYSAIKNAAISYYADNSGDIDEIDNKLLTKTSIIKYIEGISNDSPIDGEYIITSRIDEGPDNSYDVGCINSKGILTTKKISQINKEFRLFLVIKEAYVDNKWQYPHLTESQFRKMAKDIGYNKVYVDGSDTFNDNQTTIYIGLVEK